VFRITREAFAKLGVETMNRKLVNIFASTVQARLNCLKSGNTEWEGKHEAYLCKLSASCLASGSGFDSGTKIDLDNSTGERLVFTTAFHHMDEWGGYDGWTEHTVIVTPSLVFGFNLRVTGKDRNDIKEHIAESFRNDLDCEHDEHELHAALNR
jgi:hypothetical protein